MFGAKRRGGEIETPSYLDKNSRAALSAGLLLSLGESLTFNSGVTVNRPQSKARSWIALRHKPFRGFVRFFKSTDHGTMWLAVSNSVIDNPVIQH